MEGRMKRKMPMYERGEEEQGIARLDTNFFFFLFE